MKLLIIMLTPVVIFETGTFVQHRRRQAFLHDVTIKTPQERKNTTLSSFFFRRRCMLDDTIIPWDRVVTGLLDGWKHRV